MSQEEINLEREKTESYKLGRIAQLEDVATELRERSGEVYANADYHAETKQAKLLKSLAREYEDRAEDKRERWREEYKGEGE